MISRTEVELLLRQSTLGSPVLSVYLDVDQSNASNLRRKFYTALEDMLRSIEARLKGEPLADFAADSTRVLEHIRLLEPSGKGLVLFADASEGFFWSREVHIPVHNTARWSDAPYVKPLLALIDDYERYGVVLVDKERGRLFTVFMGEISEHADLLAALPV
jgi:peptide chain release factor subunit 1